MEVLDALCTDGRLLNAVPVEEVITHVYGFDKTDRDKIDSKRRAIKELRRRIQKNKLDPAGIPLQIDLTNGNFHLTPIPLSPTN